MKWGWILLDSDDKFKIRKAYQTYKYIESINPNYDKTRELMDEAYQRGIEFRYRIHRKSNPTDHSRSAGR